MRTGDKGLDHNGQPKSNYEPGADILAKIVVLGEGPRGTLMKQAAARLGLEAGREPQVYAAGVKELWQLPDDRFKAGAVIHTLGYPLPPETFGGGFIYGMAGNVLDIGFVTGLDYRNPTTDPHNELQRMKLHPAIRKMLEGAKLIRYGAKAIPEGGLFAMPRAYADGLLIVGDSAGFLNGMRLKGIHLGMKSGMLAAETIWEALQAGASDAQTLSSYEWRFRDSWAYAELRTARNFHQGFAKGMLSGLINAGLSTLTGGAGFGFLDKLAGEPGYARMAKGGLAAQGDAARADRQRADVRQAHRRLQQRDDARREPAVSPDRCGHGHLPRSLHGRIRKPVPLLLSRCGVRADVRAYGREISGAAADQLHQLRALQDVRHRRSLSDHHVGAAARRRRPGLHRHVA